MIRTIQKKRITCSDGRTYPFELEFDFSGNQNFILWSEGEGHYYMSGQISPSEFADENWLHFRAVFNLQWVAKYIQDADPNSVTAESLYKEIQKQNPEFNLF